MQLQVSDRSGEGSGTRLERVELLACYHRPRQASYGEVARRSAAATATAISAEPSDGDRRLRGRDCGVWALLPALLRGSQRAEVFFFVCE